MTVSISEPDAGSDVGAMRTSARREGDYWVINDQKLWSSGAGARDNVINLTVVPTRAWTTVLKEISMAKLFASETYAKVARASRGGSAHGAFDQYRRARASAAVTDRGGSLGGAGGAVRRTGHFKSPAWLRNDCAQLSYTWYIESHS